MAKYRPKDKNPNSIHFIFNPEQVELISSDIAPVALYWYHDRKTERYRQLFKCLKLEWNDVKKRVSTKNKNHLRLNNLLNKIEKEYSSMLFQLQNDNEQITTKHFQDFYERIVKFEDNSKAEVSDFNSFYNKQLDIEAIKWESSTIQGQRNTLNKLNAFNATITYKEIKELPEQFEVYLLSEGLAKNTVNGHSKNLKKYLLKYIKLCKNYALLPHTFNPYDDFSVGQIKGNRIDLSFEEVERIENLKLAEGSTLDIIRDRYLFSCYTGLRLAYNNVLSTEHVHISDITGIQLLMNTLIKVDYELNLDLRYLFDGKPEKILLKYLSLDEIKIAHKNNKPRTIFPKMTEPHINRNLKQIAYLCGINKLLTFHTARHTCGTNLADTGADIRLIMEIMGIRKVDTAEIYIHRSSERRRTRLSQLNWKVYKNQQDLKDDEKNEAV